MLGNPFNKATISRLDHNQQTTSPPINEFYANYFEFPTITAVHKSLEVKGTSLSAQISKTISQHSANVDWLYTVSGLTDQGFRNAINNCCKHTSISYEGFEGGKDLVFQFIQFAQSLNSLNQQCASAELTQPKEFLTN